ncbi:MAG: carbamate kinase [bacterium]|nr:carbamate kinase [Candidatus Sumerlaeota bacterium]
MRDTAVLIALGGNAISPQGEEGNITQQFDHTRETMRGLTRALRGRFARVVLTHGNGPQIGNIMLRSELAAPQVYPLPLDTCVSDSEGGMGYMIQQVLYNVLREEEPAAPPRVACVLTQIVVRPDDPMWRNPTKFIGRFYGEEEARQLAAARGWTMREDAGRGWRRVVPSPAPVEIIETAAVRALLERNFYVIAAGGGGIPVMCDEAGRLRGVEAVIDKDLASALLASNLGIGLLVILTGVDAVALDYGKPAQRFISRMTSAQTRRHLDKGQFPAGSMGPKIQAALNFLAAGGQRVIITSPASLALALEGQAGTRIEA